MPSTPTASVAVLPTSAVTLTGCVTIDGATAAGALADTVNTAELLVALPALLETVTVKLPALSAVTPVRRSTGLLAPASAMPFRYH